MKKRGKKVYRTAKKTSKTKKLEMPLPFKDVKFNRSFITILLAVLILILAFMVYSHYGIKMPSITEYKEEVQMGHECTVDLDCPQPRCPGMKGLCENGFCIVKPTGPIPVKCFDLKVPVCGNDVCEGDEIVYCPEDCEDETESICVENGKCEIDLIELGYSDNENSENCPNDCWCGDEICDDYEKIMGTCPEDC